MHRDDPKAILRAMVAVYPRRLDADELYRRTGIDATRMRRAIWGLVDGGFVETLGSPSWIGLPRRWPRLSEAGMAVGAGLATLDECAADIVRRLERRVVLQLQSLSRDGELGELGGGLGELGGPAEGRLDVAPRQDNPNGHIESVN